MSRSSRAVLLVASTLVTGAVPLTVTGTVWAAPDGGAPVDPYGAAPADAPVDPYGGQTAPIVTKPAPLPKPYTQPVPADPVGCRRRWCPTAPAASTSAPAPRRR
ncbi:MAG: hypothetical protein R2939_15410 [Kofleriaceae bacterium]